MEETEWRTFLPIALCHGWARVQARRCIAARRNRGRNRRRSTSQWPGNNWQRGAVGLPPGRRNVRHVWVAEALSGGVRRSRSFDCGVVGLLSFEKSLGAAVRRRETARLHCWLHLVVPAGQSCAGRCVGPETMSRPPSKSERLKRARSRRIPSAARFRLLCHCGRCCMASWDSGSASTGASPTPPPSPPPSGPSQPRALTGVESRSCVDSAPVWSWALRRPGLCRGWFTRPCLESLGDGKSPPMLRRNP